MYFETFLVRSLPLCLPSSPRRHLAGQAAWTAKFVNAIIRE